MADIVKKLGGIDRNLSKSEIVKLANENAQTVIDSKKYDLLKVYIELKRYEAYLKVVIAKINKFAFAKATEVVHKTQPPGRKTFEYAHAQVNISTRTVWDFSADKIWKELDDKIKELTQKKKEREIYLKANSKPITIVDTETGEIKETSDIPKEINKGLTIRL